MIREQTRTLLSVGFVLVVSCLAAPALVFEILSFVWRDIPVRATPQWVLGYKADCAIAALVTSPVALILALVGTVVPWFRPSFRAAAGILAVVSMAAAWHLNETYWGGLGR